MRPFKFVLQNCLFIDQILHLVGEGIERFDQGLNQLGRICGHDADADANPGRSTRCLTSGPAAEILSFCPVKAPRVSLGGGGRKMVVMRQVKEIANVRDCLFIQAGDFLRADAG